MKKNYVKRYAAYLNDVVSYYNKNKKLTGFSCIAKQHRISKITTAQFYENNLHVWGDTPLTREKIIDVVKNVTGKDYSDSEYNFPLNEMVAWENESGYRTVAYTQLDKNDFLPYLLNYRGRKDEQDRVWEFEDPSNLDDRKAVKPTYDDVCRYAIAMHKQAAYYQKHYWELLNKHPEE
jgi:hypothetical protein